MVTEVRLSEPDCIKKNIYSMGENTSGGKAFTEVIGIGSSAPRHTFYKIIV